MLRRQVEDSRGYAAREPLGELDDQPHAVARAALLREVVGARRGRKPGPPCRRAPRALRPRTPAGTRRRGRASPGAGSISSSCRRSSSRRSGGSAGAAGNGQAWSPLASPAATTCVAPAVVVAEHAGVEVAEREHHRAGERGEVDEVRRALAARRTSSASASTSRPSASVLITSIVLPFAPRRMSPGRYAPPPITFSVARDDRDHAQRECRARRSRPCRDHGAAAGHVALHVLHAQRRLERDAARVERDRLADEAEHDVAARARRLVAQHDQPRLVVAARRDRGERAHAERLDPVRPERLDRSGARHLRRRLRARSARRAGRELVRGRGSRGRGHGWPSARRQPPARPPP